MTKKVALAKEIEALEKDLRSRKSELSSLEASIKVVTYNRDKLIRRLSNIDGLPVLKHEVYGGKETFFEDPTDKILNKWNEEEQGLYAGCSPCYALYSSSKKPTDIVAKGKVVFIREDYDEYGEPIKYESPILESPNYAEALMYFFKSMHVVGNYHHVYFEGVHISDKVDDKTIIEFCYGS